ncbi:hypothetical protein APE_1936.1 [Aeropyrum pernix K1]|uniref:Uncharacterized protein n=2 Tax=Aeropyrum pernix TaxID=56636 RepID=Q9YAK4_AERPE|nr:hypothetical protein [Aeropyrum pernix]BAA80945.2 hypothetical protein APE_1936.1 [Aeropyrum pernix K1]GBF08508.1 hypothetical protein apy_02330 [Aeropyrum pernix]
MESLRGFLERYGEKGYIVLKAILEESQSPGRGPKPGDFSFRGLRARIASYGLEYNPSLLLARLEREYGVIETSFRSSNQHWWRIRDRRSVEKAVREYEGAEEEPLDPRVRVLRIQFWSLEPERLLKRLRRLSSLRSQTPRDRRAIREIAFEILPLLARFLEEAYNYEEQLEREIMLAEEILSEAEKALASPSQPKARLLGEDARIGGAREPV